MVIVEAIALSTMICNDLFMPIILRIPMLRIGSLTNVLLIIRRWSIVLVLFLGYAYFRVIGEFYPLVSIGLVSFAAVAQFAPAILGGIFWKAGTRAGALTGLIAGFGIWVYTPCISVTRPGRIVAGTFDNGRHVRYHNIKTIRNCSD